MIETRLYGWLRVPVHPRTNVVWHMAKPFRLREVLMWGWTSATLLESVCLSGCEQIAVSAVPYGKYLAHSFELGEIRRHCRLPDLGLFQDLSTWMRLSTGSQFEWASINAGGEMRLSVAGPLSDLILVGESPEGAR